MSKVKKGFLVFLSLLPAFILFAVGTFVLLNSKQLLQLVKLVSIFLETNTSGADATPETWASPTVIISACTLIVTTVSTVSTIWLAWRGERRQSQESQLTIQQLRLQLDEARSKIASSSRISTETPGARY